LFDLIRVLRSPLLTERLGLPMEGPVYHRNLEGIVVNLVNSSAVAQAIPGRSGFDPFKRRLFCPFLIFKNCVFLSVTVNDFEFVYRVSFSNFHSASQVDECNFAGEIISTAPVISPGSHPDLKCKPQR